jgi:hypothetical protein
MLQTESLLLVALGFGIAMVLALIIGYLMWSAANRWVEARRKKAVPGMILNLQAERAALRAENAMTEQRYRDQIEIARTELAEKTAEVNRHRNRAMAHAEALTARDAELAELQAQLEKLGVESRRRGQALLKMREQRRLLEKGKAAVAVPEDLSGLEDVGVAPPASPEETALRIQSRIAEIKSKVTVTEIPELKPILPSPLEASGEDRPAPGLSPRVSRFPKPVLVSSSEPKPFEKPEGTEEPEKKMTLAEKFKAIRGGAEF